MREVEGEGACWEGVEMTSPDQLVCVAASTLYTCWYTWVCSIRVRTAVMGLA